MTTFYVGVCMGLSSASYECLMAATIKTGVHGYEAIKSINAINTINSINTSNSIITINEVNSIATIHRTILMIQLLLNSNNYCYIYIT